jgi:hypothetical protein
MRPFLFLLSLILVLAVLLGWTMRAQSNMIRSLARDIA